MKNARLSQGATMLESARAVQGEQARTAQKAMSHGTLADRSSTIEFSSEPKTLAQIRRSRVDLEKRYVFLCPTSLNKQFDVIPTEAKAKALLVFRCSRDWMFPTQADRLRGVSHRVDCGKVSGGRRNRPQQQGSTRPWTNAQDLSREFLQWVQQKEKEEFVFWMKPERSFQKLSRFFESHIDPVTRMNYQPMLLDSIWWRVKFTATKCARYVHNPAAVIAELSEHSTSKNFEISALQELIFQSNPTLEPIVLWPHAPSLRCLPITGGPRAADSLAAVGRSDRQYAGEASSTARGYISYDNVQGMDATGGASTARQISTRMKEWPTNPSARLDNLQARWQLEDAVSARQSTLCLSARAQLESRPAYSIAPPQQYTGRPHSEDTRRALETSLALRDLHERNMIRGMSHNGSNLRL